MTIADLHSLWPPYGNNGTRSTFALRERVQHRGGGRAGGRGGREGGIAYPADRTIEVGSSQALLAFAQSSAYAFVWHSHSFALLSGPWAATLVSLSTAIPSAPPLGAFDTSHASRLVRQPGLFASHLVRQVFA